jgi:hypothetical protein
MHLGQALAELFLVHLRGLGLEAQIVDLVAQWDHALLQLQATVRRARAIPRRRISSTLRRSASADSLPCLASSARVQLFLQTPCR